MSHTAALATWSAMFEHVIDPLVVLLLIMLVLLGIGVLGFLYALSQSINKVKADLTDVMNQIGQGTTMGPTMGTEGAQTYYLTRYGETVHGDRECQYIVNSRQVTSYRPCILCGPGRAGGGR